MMRTTLVVLYFTLLAVALAPAQFSRPSTPDNAVTNLDGNGLPSTAAREGTAEKVNLHNGALTMFIPVLTLPQKHGMKPLVLGYSYDSNQYKVRETVSGSVSQYGIDDVTVLAEYDAYADTESITNSSTPFQLNIPRLVASTEYEGSGFVPSRVIDTYYNVYCLENYVFTDWTGVSHPFRYARSNCAPSGSIYSAVPNLVTRDVSNDYLIDVSNLNDIVVTGPDGEAFHFSDQNSLDQTANSIVDRNGNVITIGTGTITDSLGRTITFGSVADAGVISYKDSNGTPQTVSLARETAPTPDTDTDIGPYLTQNSCTLNMQTQGPPPDTQYTLFTTGPSGMDGIHWPAVRNAYSLTYSGSGQQYHYVFDGFGHLLKVTYPSGGYHRYDYIAYPFLSKHWLSSCQWQAVQVNHRYECQDTSGSCGSSNPELVTTYKSDGVQTDGTTGSITVINPDGTSVYHKLNDMYQPIVPEPLQISYDGAAHTTHRIQTTPATFNDCPSDSQLETTTDTVYEGGSYLQKKIFTLYAAVPLLPHMPDSDSCYNMQAVETEEQGFDGTTIRTTSSTPYNNFTKNLIGLPGTTEAIDNVFGLSHTTVNNYDSDGHLISTTASGTNATSSTTYLQNYDSYGRPTKAIDPRNAVTGYTYGTNWADSNCTVSPGSMLTAITNALGQTTQYSYYTCSGLLASVTDPNGSITHYQYDGAGRLTSSVAPDGGSTTSFYVDTAPITISQTQTASPDPDRTSSITYDGVMQPVSAISGESLAAPIYTAMSYDNMGRKTSRTNPYYSSADTTYGVTSYAYDSQGRIKYVCNPDNNSSSSTSCSPGSSYTEQSYSIDTANSLHVQDSYDELRHRRTAEYDAFGNLRMVLEYGSAGTTTTSYAYSGFGNLTSVSQNGLSGEVARQQRTFQYDGLSHLLSSFNPETGLNTYTYDANGNLKTKTDALGVMTTYSYDSLNRLLSKTYSNAPSGTLSSCYQYDGVSVGRLNAEWTQGGACSSTVPTTAYSSSSTDGYQSLRTFTAYDSMGRILSERQCMPNAAGLGSCATSSPNPFALSYRYNQAGNTTAYTNGVNNVPGAGTIAFGLRYDEAGRLQYLSGSWNPSTNSSASPQSLFTADPTNGYTAAGTIQNIFLGNNIFVNKTYDNRLRTTGENATHR
jgi:YD repeat-containing protein